MRTPPQLMSLYNLVVNNTIALLCTVCGLRNGVGKGVLRGKAVIFNQFLSSILVQVEKRIIRLGVASQLPKMNTLT